MATDDLLDGRSGQYRSLKDMAQTGRSALQFGFDAFLVSAVLLCLLAVFLPALRNGPHLLSPLVVGVGTVFLVAGNRQYRARRDESRLARRRWRRRAKRVERRARR